MTRSGLTVQKSYLSAKIVIKKADREINLNGNLLMPSFKNAHTHSAMTFARSLADDLPLQPWLYDMIFPMEAKLTGEDIYHLSKLAFLEYLTSGVSACFDMYYFLRIWQGRVLISDSEPL